MTLHIYSLQNAYLGVFEAPMTRLEDEKAMAEMMRRSVLSDPDGCYKAYGHEKTLYYIGEFDEETAKITIIEQPKAIVPLAKLFPPGYLARMESDAGAAAKRN